jgi:hypothetical protein
MVSKDSAQIHLTHTDNEATHPDDEGVEIVTDNLEPNKGMFTRQSEPFKGKRIEAVLRAVQIGTDLSEEQHATVRNLIATYADCFALSVREVIPAQGARLDLNIPHDASLPLKVWQRAFTPPQRQYLHHKVLEMLDAGIIERADPAKIKCVSQTTLGQKQHDGAGLTLEELQRKVNEECIAAGLTPHFQVPPRDLGEEPEKEEPREQKW